MVTALVGIVMAAISPKEYAPAVPSGYHAGITIFLLFMVPFVESSQVTSLDVFEALSFQCIQLIGLSFDTGSAATNYWLYAAMPAYACLFAATYYIGGTK